MELSEEKTLITHSSECARFLGFDAVSYTHLDVYKRQPTTMNLYYQNKTNHDFARGSPKAG